MPLSLNLPAIPHQIAHIPNCTRWTCCERHRKGEILQDNNMLFDFYSTLRVGDTVVPLICMSNGTHLANFAPNQKQHAVYMTISNLSSKIVQMSSMHSVIIVTLLVIVIKIQNIPQERLAAQWQPIREVLNEVFWRVLQALTIKQNPDTKSGYYNVLSPDGILWRCKPVLVAWLANCPEYCDLHHHNLHMCIWR